MTFLLFTEIYGPILYLGNGSDIMFFIYLIYRWFKQPYNCNVKEGQVNNWHKEIVNRELEWEGYRKALIEMRQSETKEEKIHAERVKEEHLSRMIASIDYKVFVLANGLKEETDTIKSSLEKIEQDQSRFIRWSSAIAILFSVMLIALIWKTFVA